MPHIRHYLSIRAPKEKVQEAITSVRGLSSWWTPVVKRTPENELIFRFGPDYTKTMQVEEESEEKVVWMCSDAHPEWINTIIRFELKEENMDTELLFAHDDWDEYTEMYALCNFNWALYLRSLKKYCENGEGNPYPDNMDL